jgi:hypothetical protein
MGPRAAHQPCNAGNHGVPRQLGRAPTISGFVTRLFLKIGSCGGEGERGRVGQQSFAPASYPPRFRSPQPWLKVCVCCRAPRLKKTKKFQFVPG